MQTVTNPRLIVIGALHVDEIAIADGPLVLGESNPVTWTRRVCGVAANLCRAAVKTNAEVAVNLIARCSRHGDGAQLIQAMTELGIKVLPVDSDTVGTGRYSAILQSDGDVLIGLSDTTQAERFSLASIHEATDIAAGDTCVMDGNLSEDTLNAFASSQLIGLCVSPAKAIRFWSIIDKLDLIFCNLSEAQALAKHTTVSEADQPDPKALSEHLSRLGKVTVVITHGEHGIWIASRGVATVVPIQSIAQSVTLNGPGDALAGATIAQLTISSINHDNVVKAVTMVGLPAAAAVLNGKNQAPELEARKH